MEVARIMTAAALAVITAGSALASAGAAQASERSGAVIAVTAPAAARASGDSKPCFWTIPDCSSSDPHVAFGIVNNGDTSACTYSVTAAWGDGAKETKNFSGGPDGQTAAVFDHLYAKRGSYTVTVTGTTTHGSCSAPNGTLSFTLTKIKTKLTLAALGDSYASGDGASGQKHGPPSCDRIPGAWEFLLASALSAQVSLPGKNFIACSGASSANKEDKGLKRLDGQLGVLKSLAPQPTLVTLMIGGDDNFFPWKGKELSLADLAENCYHQKCVKDGEVAAADRNIDSEERVLADDYKALPAASATILIVGYPRVFEETHFCGEKGLGLGFSVAEEKALNDLADTLDGLIARAAAGAQLPYVSLSTVFREHEVCTQDPWVHHFDLANLAASWHPNDDGYKHIAALVKDYIATKL